jgi:hypothetical protein
LKNAGLAVDGPSLLQFFRKRTLTEAGQQRIEILVKDLGDNSYKVRVKASSELVALGAVAVPYLRRAVKNPDLEVSRRAEDCLKQISESESARAGLAEAAAHLIALRKPEGAVAVLLAYIPFAPDELVAGEVQAALAALAVRNGKPDAVLITALGDKLPARRAAAVEALCRGGMARQIPEIRQRLQDRDLSVRLRAALALATAREKEAVPVLIDLLAQLGPEQAWPAEDLLLRLAADQAPAVALGHDEASRRKCRDTWAAWWQAHAATADLARIEGAGQPLGYTLLVLLKAGQVIELDAKDQCRFQVDGLELPLDAQMLPGDRVLVAEHDGDRITERNRKGEILWEYKVEKPLMAQRLPNGHTFIATQALLLEVDRQGKEVFRYSRPGGEPFMKAMKLPNGDIAFVTLLRRFVRLDSTGRELQNIPANVSTSGGRIDVLPGGRVLVPERTSNRVVEYDAEGKVVWQVLFPEPVAATRLPNGHTLVTSYSGTRAVELDRAGQQVWEYRSSTRVTRAFRR